MILNLLDSPVVEWMVEIPFPYFVANPDGNMTEEQLEKLSLFGLVIIEFQMGQLIAEELSVMWENGDLGFFRIGFGWLY